MCSIYLSVDPIFQSLIVVLNRLSLIEGNKEAAESRVPLVKLKS
jgi:hypothetical protein